MMNRGRNNHHGRGGRVQLNNRNGRNHQGRTPNGQQDGRRAQARPVTPSDGRAQTFVRAGNPDEQQTRTFPNGTTLTYGPNDHVDDFPAGAPFGEQGLELDHAMANLVADIPVRFSEEEIHRIPLTRASRLAREQLFSGNFEATEGEMENGYYVGRNSPEVFELPPPIPTVFNNRFDRSNWVGESYTGDSVDTRGGGRSRGRNETGQRMRSAVDQVRSDQRAREWRENQRSTLPHQHTTGGISNAQGSQILPAAGNFGSIATDPFQFPYAAVFPPHNPAYIDNPGYTSDNLYAQYPYKPIRVSKYENLDEFVANFDPTEFYGLSSKDIYGNAGFHGMLNGAAVGTSQKAAGARDQSEMAPHIRRALEAQLGVQNSEATETVNHGEVRTVGGVAGPVTYGASGASGASVATGASGASGASGVYGAPSASGTYGASGASGAFGASSASGASGASGAFGASGASGASGVYGVSGVSGASGASGVYGVSGASVASGVSDTGITAQWQYREYLNNQVDDVSQFVDERWYRSIQPASMQRRSELRGGHQFGGSAEADAVGMQYLQQQILNEERRRQSQPEYYEESREDTGFDHFVSHADYLTAMVDREEGFVLSSENVDAYAQRQRAWELGRGSLRSNQDEDVQDTENEEDRQEDNDDPDKENRQPGW